jgi:hypothetical protein
MSDLIRRLNIIKRERRQKWLTHSQKIALSTIRRMLRIPGMVNLYGAAGVGKTFLAWTVADELNYIYLPHPSQLFQLNSSKPEGIILDNSVHTRLAHRELLKELQFLQIARAIIVTRKAIQDYISFVELDLSVSDQVKVIDNLTEVGIITTNTKQFTNLWYLVNPYL